MAVEVYPIVSKKEIKEFVKLQWEIYKNDPHWIAPLYLERMDHLNSSSNPFFEHAEVQLFLARDESGRPVGRISAQLNFEHDKIYEGRTGFFGFFESPNNSEVAKALFDTAEQWCRDRNCDRIRGPFSFSINDECGCLVDGFDTPPYMFMAHNPPYYPTLIEENGFTKIKDLYAWRYYTGELNDFTKEIADSVIKTPGLVVRDLDKKHLDRDVRIVLDVFNSAWSKNWGYVPLTEAEIQKMTSDFRLLAEPTLIKIAEVEGKPAAIMLAMPNLNEAIRDLNGSLLPFGIFKLLYRVKGKKIKTSRLILLGIKKEFRGGAFSGGSLSVLLYVKAHEASKTLGQEGGELGWTLEDNEKINQGIELMGAKRYKTYRIFEKELS